MPTYTLPELPYDLAALEPHYSAEVLEIHHGKPQPTQRDAGNAGGNRSPDGICATLTHTACPAAGLRPSG